MLISKEKKSFNGKRLYFVEIVGCLPEYLPSPSLKFSGDSLIHTNCTAFVNSLLG